ncbi:MAG: glycosyltransferase [Deltaproteobacteria bacterium]|nr:glycosyltransferase [Deltaproteobacteria bacterium]
MKKYKNKTIWLSYVSYPITTAVYLERALRKICRVITVGPQLPEEYIERWSLQAVKQPIRPLDIDTSFSADMAEILQKSPAEDHPDLFLWIESTNGGFFPINLHALNCPRVCYLIDSHLNLETHLQIVAFFDYVFIAQRAYLDKLREVNPRTYWLPLACDPDVHGNKTDVKCHEIGFVGKVISGSRREKLLSYLNANIPIYYDRCFLEDMARIFSESRVVFNEAVNYDLNMRFFEVLASGSLLLADMASGSGQDELFVEGEDYALYHDSNLIDVSRFYLDNERIREKTAARGQRLVLNAHTYLHRVEDLLHVVLGGKAETFSAAELRSRSIAGLAEPDHAWRSRATPTVVPSRSFVIPVLDYSPASEYNIMTLLKDLENVPGQVVVVFNDPGIAEELRTHPRIDHYIIMQRNVGVSRAWNVGLDVTESQTVFILNADLHVSAGTIDDLEKGLWSLYHAACVGPQGSFVNFRLAGDHLYFDKGTFSEPVEVDAVSGFLFCVKRELFDNRTLKFEAAFSPCYFEEWDLGLQIRMADLKSYVIPTTGYDHHWSGTIRALRTIPYLGREETAGEIVLRNRELFQTKWRGIARREKREHLLQSLWRNYAFDKLQHLIASGDITSAAELCDRLISWYPEDAKVKAAFRFLELQLLKYKTGDGK